jgi:NTE family protein
MENLILKEIPLFAGLSDSERSLIRERGKFIEYKKGQIIYREGSPADAFYCVISGRVIIYTTSPCGGETVLEYLHRGKYFGIISLLTGEAHSVTARTINDCLLLVIKKEDFDFILTHVPRLAIGLSQALSRRLKNKDIHQKTIFESTVISVFSSYSQAGKTIYALNLALGLYKETHKSVIILDICTEGVPHSLPSKLEVGDGYQVFNLSDSLADTVKPIKEFILNNRFGVDLLCLSYNTQDESCVKTLLGTLSLLVNDYHYIILDLPVDMDMRVFDILNQSDLIHILSSPEQLDLKKTCNLIERLKEDFHFQEEKIKIIINEYKLSKLNPEEQMDLLGCNIFATLPKIEFCASERIFLDNPDSEYALAIKRISRRVGDCLVGVALGVGFAYGFCHIGVLKVIEEEKIPVDVISGSSVGAFIASLWAIGKSAGEIIEITKEFKEPNYIRGLIDLTFPLIGFIKGKKIHRFFKKHLGNKTFHDVRLPLKIIASDVKRKESRVFDTGLLADAVMASCSMPGLFMPFRLKEDMLMDGGVINPLPTEILFKMGVRKIIAVNVTPSREDVQVQYEKLKGQISVEKTLRRKFFSFKQWLRNVFKINILDIIFSSIEVMQSEMIQREAQLADIVLHPKTEGLHWLELHRAEDLAKRGEEEARKNLDKIWQIINE